MAACQPDYYTEKCNRNFFGQRDWKTLAAFISCGQNYSKTAELLFLHPKTVKYRISKLQSVLDLDFEDPEQVFRIMLDSRLFRLQDHFHSEE